jgi:hypothetical protein
VLTVIDDGHGVPVNYADRILEPGVTSRHLTSPSAGLSLHHVNQTCQDLRLASNANPTAITAIFDTAKVLEKTLQSSTRPSNSNMLSRMRAFRKQNQQPATLVCGSPSQVLAALLNNHIIRVKSGIGFDSEVSEAWGFATKIGLALSERTVRRVLLGEVRSAQDIAYTAGDEPVAKLVQRDGGVGDGVAVDDSPVMRLTDKEVGEIAGILGRAAAARYLAVSDVRVESRSGELRLQVRVNEPEEEYE